MKLFIFWQLCVVGVLMFIGGVLLTKYSQVAANAISNELQKNPRWFQVLFLGGVPVTKEGLQKKYLGVYYRLFGLLFLVVGVILVFVGIYGQPGTVYDN